MNASRSLCQQPFFWRKPGGRETANSGPEIIPRKGRNERDWMIGKGGVWTIGGQYAPLIGKLSLSREDLIRVAEARRDAQRAMGVIWGQSR